jgi:spore coat protein A
MLNACNARFLNINVFQVNPKNVDGIDLDPKKLFPLNPAGPKMIQIGTEGGFLATETTHVSPKPFNPATLTGNLLLGPAERADVVIDFTGLAGKEFILYNDAPGPFPAGPATTDYFLGNPNNPLQPITILDKNTRQKWSTGPDTRQILRIKVVAAAAPDPQPNTAILDPAKMDPAPLVPYTTSVAPIPPLPLPSGAYVRDLTLNEDFDSNGRLRQLLGTTTPNLVGKGFGLDYLAPATEVVQEGSVEVWRIWNLTADTHPMHFHIVNVQVLSRQPFAMIGGAFTPNGPARGPQPNELGWKETVQMHPGEVTTIIMKCDLPTVPFEVPDSPRMNSTTNALGIPYDSTKKYHEFVWHCHILEHEEHDMMRPLVVT